MNEFDKILISQEDIAKRVKELSQQISRDYKDLNPLFVCILKGSVIFTADLLRNIDTPAQIDFMSVSSYGSGTESSGVLNIKKDLSVDIEGKHVIVVEDIIDSGNTLFNLKNLLLSRNPASLKICTLLDKPERRVQDINADYTGFSIPDEFVVGYGLDYNENYRTLPDVRVLSRCVYEK
ncbi:MAG: hypoxanthine phosphoribosyltransferase [Clostridiales bacterium]|nr:hypoxanthine phosphoribosyltransferase [Clostridiales bacterium]